MSDIAQFTSVFRAQSLSDSHRRVTKRNRQPVSCLACRARKLRCDRSKPCGACTKRGDGDTCKFGAASSIGSSTSGGDMIGAFAPADQSSSFGLGNTNQQRQPRQDVQSRLQKLEDMVQDLVKRSAGPNKERRSVRVPTQVSPVPTDSGPRASTAPSPADGDEAYYGPNHWTALLHHIHEIQTALEPEDLGPPQPSEGVACSAGPDFLFGAVSPMISIQDVLASLPSRADTDRLLGVYFRAPFVAVPFIHTGCFQREYEAFWEHPEGTGFLWISMLFSIVSTAAIIVRAKNNADSVGLSDVLREPSAYSGRAVQCLIKGNYLTAKAHSVEATLLVAYTRNIASKDLDPVMWNMFGVATRLAQRRGYHLEPKHLSACITPFEAEMRRRAWLYCEAFDTLLSFQLGMPTVINDIDNDVGGPGNHPDEDFDESTAFMPPPRPALDPTPMLYYHLKSKICRILRRVIRHSQSPVETSYAEVRALDDALHRWRVDLPACFSVRPIHATGFSEQNHTIMHRLMLEMMYRKALCVLHRAYLTRDKKSPCFAPSRETCRVAALRILELHEEFDREASPGGRLFEDRYMLSSLTLHDFMVAAMVICLDLNESADTSDEDYEKKMSALRAARAIWSKRSDCSRDARHAAAVLGAMLQRLAGREKPRKTQGGVDGLVTDSSTVQAPVHPMPASLGLPGTGQLEQQGAYAHNGDFDFVALDNALNDSTNLDWNLLDQYLFLDHDGLLSMDLS